MAYLIGQLRKNKQTTYMTPVEGVTAITVSSPNPFQLNEARIDKKNVFTDFALQASFKSGKVYYLRFKVHKIPQYFYSGSKTQDQVNTLEAADTLGVNLILKQSDSAADESKNPPEVIGDFVVPKAVFSEPEEYVSYSFIFTPSKDFNILCFRVNRVSYDAIYLTSEDGPRNWLVDQLIGKDINIKNVTRYTNGNPVQVSTTGSRIKYENPEDGELCELQNIVTESKGWNKFGFQSRPGSLIVVNKQPIRVGRSGIYQINNGTKITSFMIASPEGSDSSKIDAFLLDYTYNT